MVQNCEVVIVESVCDLVAQGPHVKFLWHADNAFRDKVGGNCNVKPFQSCLIAFYAWASGQKGHLTIAEIRLSVKEVAFVTMEVWSITITCLSKSLVQQCSHKHCLHTHQVSHGIVYMSHVAQSQQMTAGVA